MVLYKTKFNWVTCHHQNMFFQSFSHDIQNCAFKTFLKFNWVTGSPPKFDTVGIMVPDMHAKFHNQPFIMRRAIWRHVFGHTLTDSFTHSHTVKPPTAGVQLVGHTSINVFIYGACLNAFRLYFGTVV